MVAVGAVVAIVAIALAISYYRRPVFEASTQIVPGEQSAPDASRATSPSPETVGHMSAVDAPEQDLCAGDAWSRPATSRLRLACLHPDYVPRVAVVDGPHIDDAAKLLNGPGAAHLSVTQARELTGQSDLGPTDRGEAFYLVRGLASDAARRGFEVMDCEDGRLLVQHLPDRWRGVTIVRQPLVVTFRGSPREVYVSCGALSTP